MKNLLEKLVIFLVQLIVKLISNLTEEEKRQFIVKINRIVRKTVKVCFPIILVLVIIVKLKIIVI